MAKIEAKDIIALVTVIGGFILLSMKIDTVVGGILVMITTYYFRKRVEEVRGK